MCFRGKLIRLSVPAPSIRGALAFALTVVGATATLADELSGYLELTKTDQKSEGRGQGVAPREMSVDSFLERYSLTLNHRFYPNLQLLMGGLFERQDSTLREQGVSADSTRKRLFPSFKLFLRTPVQWGELGYDRRQERFSAFGLSSKTIQENTRGVWGWAPEGLPRTRVELFRKNTFDQRRESLDTTVDTAQVSAEYSPTDPINLYYRGSLEKVKDRIGRSDVRSTFHGGRVTYGDSWFDRRITFGANYDVNYRRTETVVAGSGEVILPVFPVAGLASIDDTPQQDPLNTNPALIDQDLGTGAGINLGLPPPGGEMRPRNFGFDLASPTELNTLLVWVDRPLPPSISDSFSWAIYTSNNNFDWTLERTLSLAPFGSFENRFELRFASLTSRYVKLVVAPLSPTVPFASSFSAIDVTELQPQLRQRAQDLEGSASRTSSVLSLTLRSRLMNTEPLYYEMSYFRSERSRSSALYTLSNGLSISHTFNEVYSGAARVSREDRHERSGPQTGYLFTASVAAVPLETLRHSLVFSGVRDSGATGSRETTSVFLSTVASLYRGIDLNVSAGESLIETAGGGRSESLDVNVGTTVVPHRALTFDVAYQSRSVDVSGPVGGGAGEDLQIGQVGAAWRPLATVYLFASHRVERPHVAPARTLDNYSLSWTPFPEGAVRLTLAYSEIFRSELDSTETILVPSLRWNITGRMYVDASYQKVTVDSIPENSRSEVFSGTFRAAF